MPQIHKIKGFGSVYRFIQYLIMQDYVFLYFLDFSINMVEAEISNATIFWAQRKRFVFLKIEARNLENTGAIIEIIPPNIIKLDGKNRINGLVYHVNLELWHDIWIEKSSWKLTDLAVSFNITKKWRKIGFWPRLLKQEQKFKFLKIDWDRWEDPEYINPKNLLGENIDLEDYDDISQDSDSEGEKDEVPEHLNTVDTNANNEALEKKEALDKNNGNLIKSQKDQIKDDDDEDSEEDEVPEHLRNL